MSKGLWFWKYLLLWKVFLLRLYFLLVSKVWWCFIFTKRNPSFISRLPQLWRLLLLARLQRNFQCLETDMLFFLWLFVRICRRVNGDRRVCFFAFVLRFGVLEAVGTWKRILLEPASCLHLTVWSGKNETVVRINKWVLFARTVAQYALFVKIRWFN